MRRIVPLGLLLVMTGCADQVASPFVGFGGFVADTHTVYRNPNRPAGDAENMQRVFGQAATEEPLLPEPGNVWPGPLPPQMTLQDLQRENPDALRPGEEMYLGRPLGSSTPPGTGQVRPAMPAAPMPQSVQPQAAPRDTTVQTPSGAAVLNNSGGVQTYTSPTGGTGIVVPNGNGTSTLIAPDGSVQTVPSPR